MTQASTTELRPSTPRAGLHILGSIGFVALGLYFLVRGDGLYERLVALACVAFFGLCAVVLIGRRLRDRPELVIGDRGLTHVLFGAVTWDEVAGVAVRSMVAGHARHWFVEVLLHDPEAYLARQTAAKRAVITANRMLGCGPYVIATAVLGEDPDDVIDAMLVHHPTLAVAGIDTDDGG